MLYLEFFRSTTNISQFTLVNSDFLHLNRLSLQVIYNCTEQPSYKNCIIKFLDSYELLQTLQINNISQRSLHYQQYYHSFVVRRNKLLNLLLQDPDVSLITIS